MRRGLARAVRGAVASVVAGWAAAACEWNDGPPEALSLGLAESVVADSSSFDARDVRRAPDGGWWVLSDGEPFVLRYDGAGQLVASYGRRGRGPTDFIRPWLFIGEAAAGVPPLVWDVGRKMLLRIDSLGRVSPVRPLVGSLGPVRNDIERVTFNSPFLARRQSDIVVWGQHAGEISATAHMRRPAIMRLDLPTGAVDTIVSPAAADSGQDGSRATSLVAVPLWDLCPDSTLAFLGANADRVVRLRSGHDTVGVALIPPSHRKRRRLSDAAIERHVHEFLIAEFLSSRRDTSTVGEETPEVARRLRYDYPEYEPPFVRLICDAASNIWLQRFSTFTHPLGYGDEWLILNQSGGVRAVRLPARFSPSQIGAREAIGLMQDADGTTWPARLPLRF